MSLLNKILFTPQPDLTDEQKRIARENIGAAAATTEIHFDPETIDGDGSGNTPYTVKLMQAATNQANGKPGIVPTPLGGDENYNKRFLCADGTWKVLSDLITDQDLVNLIAKPYDNTRTYTLGELVFKDRKLWKCTTAISEAKDWNENDWDDITIDVYDATNSIPGLIPIYTGQGIAVLGSDGTWIDIEEYTTEYIDSLDWSKDTAVPGIVNAPNDGFYLGRDGQWIKLYDLTITPIEGFPVDDELEYQKIGEFNGNLYTNVKITVEGSATIGLFNYDTLTYDREISVTDSTAITTLTTGGNYEIHAKGTGSVTVIVSADEFDGGSSNA